jgi:D-Tyr-tRNAtyr deacylase
MGYPKEIGTYYTNDVQEEILVLIFVSTQDCTKVVPSTSTFAKIKNLRIFSDCPGGTITTLR